MNEARRTRQNPLAARTAKTRAVWAGTAVSRRRACDCVCRSSSETRPGIFNESESAFSLRGLRREYNQPGCRVPGRDGRRCRGRRRLSYGDTWLVVLPLPSHHQETRQQAPERPGELEQMHGRQILELKYAGSGDTPLQPGCQVSPLSRSHPVPLLTCASCPPPWRLRPHLCLPRPGQLPPTLLPHATISPAYQGLAQLQVHLRASVAALASSGSASA